MFTVLESQARLAARISVINLDYNIRNLFAIFFLITVKF